MPVEVQRLCRGVSFLLQTTDERCAQGSNVERVVNIAPFEGLLREHLELFGGENAFPGSWSLRIPAIHDEARFDSCS
ncbi:MAG: hypothetical protein ACREDF_06790, partial [Thermoplasmata archaeon]